MSMAINNSQLWCAVVVAMGVGVGCSAPDKGTPTEPREVSRASGQALTSSNGLWQNGLSTNGLWQNGLWQNGLWQNGLWQNGLWQNGLWQNGLWQNGLWQNGLWQNGLWQNGLWQNGLSADGGVVPGSPAATLQSSPYLRELLQYIYSCAMPGALDPITNTALDPTTYNTTLDPNNGALKCAPPDVAGEEAGADGAPACDVGYTCSSQGSCVIALNGAIGLAINADGSSWWGEAADGGFGDGGVAGTCDESCQRWVSACVLARTNAYGQHVEISMRVPDSAPQAIRNALATSPKEIATYTLREGAYYGNIFETTPAPLVCSGPASSCNVPGPSSATCYTECVPGGPPPSAPDGGAYSGPAIGPVAQTPNFYACAGPDSNVPEITKRFCSSQGDQSVINVPGVCLANADAGETGVCAGQDPDPNGAIHDCATCAGGGAACATNGDCCSQSCSGGKCAAGGATGTNYGEVITVYLQQPIAVCGNAVCEPPGEDAASCPSDCHPGTWGKSVDGDGYTIFDYYSTMAVDPIDGSTVVAGVESGIYAIVVDNTVSPPITLPATSDVWDLVVIKYDSTGKYLWGERIPVNTWGPWDAIVSVGPDESIFLSGWYSAEVNRTIGPTGAFFVKLSKDGTLASVLAPSPTIALSGAYPDAVYEYHSRVDFNGDLLVEGTFLGSATFGAISLSNTTSGKTDMFVEKICGGTRTDCTLGDVLWASRVGVSEQLGNSLAIDGNGDVLVAGWSGIIYKLSGQTGLPLAWTNQFFYVEAVASDPNDSSHDVYELGNSLENRNHLTLAKYSTDGTTLRWETPLCATSCTGLRGMALAFDGAGNVITSGEFGPFGTADFGAGVFTAYAYPNLFAAAYRELDGGFSWAKGFPMILGGPPPSNTIQTNYLSFDYSVGRLVFGGAFSGSMQLDSHLLLSALPESTSVVNAFVGAIQPPSTADTMPPCIGNIGTCSSAPTTVPSNILSQATSQCGAVVFFMPPTAIDDGDPDAGAPPPGTSVACSPPPNTMFQIGMTPVTCTATDAVGNSSSATFTVTVGDTVAPTFLPFANITVPATGANGATVSYTPTATDEVDCSTSASPDAGPACTPTSNPCRPVSCLPASPAVFPIGTTPVTCTATDSAHNTAQMTFSVVVTPAGGCNTCAAQGATCGTISDDCGDTLNCGSCTGFQTCGGGGTPNVCGCKAATSCPAGDNCGTAPDGCGGMVNCGTCTGFQTCGGGGMPNVCGCKAATSCPAGDNCGTIPNGCGGMLSCGSCTAPQTCGGSGKANECGCTPVTACPAGDKCGTIPNGCGGALSCGSCTSPQTCGGGGVANECGCTPTTCSAQKVTCGTISNGCGGTLNCGPPCGPSLASFALYATEAIEMDTGASVTGCNVGVENTTGPFLGGGVPAYLNSGAKIQSTETLYASSVFLSSGSSVGPIDTNHLTGSSGATHGAVSAFPTMPVPPAAPSAKVGTTAVTLSAGTSKTLASGAYGAVTVNSNATLTLTGGTYVFSSLNLNAGATLVVKAATLISVTGTVGFSNGSFLGPASGSGLTAKSLAVYFDSSSAINVGSGAKIRALFFAPSALVNLNTSSFTGGIEAAQVIMNTNATITCEDGLAPAL